MAKPTVDSVSRLAEKFHRQYQAEYAGKPRHSRPLEPLERLIAKLRDLAHKAKKLPGERGRELAKVVSERLELYARERDAIAAARFEDPSVGELHGLSQRINRAMALWRRRVAGHDRLVVELELVDAIAAALAAARPRLAAQLEAKRTLELSGALNTVETQLMLIADERGEIDKARRNASPEQRAAALAGRANVAFDELRVHFAGHARLTCEPDRLRALIARFEAIVAEMRAPEHAAAHAPNITLIEGQLPGLVAEVAALASAHAAASDRDRAHALGAAANRVFELYGEHFAGQARGTRNLRLLGDLCDRLDAVRGQMEALLAADDPINAKNLPIVETRLAAYEQEWVEIAKVKAAQAQPAQVTEGPRAPARPKDPLANLLKVE